MGERNVNFDGDGEFDALDDDLDELIPESARTATPMLIPVGGTLARADLLYAGIDPGLDGYVALLSADGTRVVDTFETPVFLKPGTADPEAYDEKSMLDICMALRGRVALLFLEEQSVVRPPSAHAAHNSMVSNFTKGVGFGLWRMALTAAGLPRRELLPIQWKKIAGVKIAPTKGGSKLQGDELEQHRKKRREDGKNLAIETVRRLHPTLDLRRNIRCRTPHDGKCEAILMAHVARRLHLG